jgi:hypothetical protein
MHKLKHIWYNCQTCGKSKTYSGYTVHKIVFDCSCGEFIIKHMSISERMVSNNNKILDQTESYALAWGMEGWN